GATGPAGPAGPAGADGPPGPSNAYVAFAAHVSLDVTDFLATVLTKDVPVGSYVVSASLTFFDGLPSGELVTCVVSGLDDAAAIGRITVRQLDQETLTIQSAGVHSQAGPLTLACTPALTEVEIATLTAIQVATVQ